MTVAVRSLEARVFVHATEDKSKVLIALRNVIGEAQVTEEDLRGYFGNQIIVMTAHCGPEAAGQVFDRILQGLSEPDRRFLLSTLEERLTKDGALHLRLDKQKALKGKFVLNDSDDVIKIVVRFSGGRKGAEEYIRSKAQVNSS
ncbi:MAG: RNA-binding domain-containing protein [Acidilobus sp.]